jgi:hypothetical protein
MEAFDRLYLMDNKWWFKYVAAAVSLLMSSVMLKFGGLQADYYINKVTGIDSGYLSAAESMLKVLFFIPFFLLLTSVLMQFYSWILFINFVRNDNENPKVSKSVIDTKVSGLKSDFINHWTPKRIIHFIRFLSKIAGSAVIVASCQSAIKSFSGEGAVFGLAKYLLIESEFFSVTHCKNKKIISGERVAVLDRGNVAIFNEKLTPQFRIEKCEIYGKET